MNMPFAASFKKIGHPHSAGRLLAFWYRYYKVLFFLLFFIVLMMGAWNWYYSIYRYRLSDEEKKQYVEQYFKETTFKEAKFRDIVKSLSERARRHEETLRPERNIFEGQGIRPKESL